MTAHTQRKKNNKVREGLVVVEGEKLERVKYENVFHPSIVPSKLGFQLGGVTKIGVTRKAKKDSRKVKKAKVKMAQRNNKKIRHHWTKKEHKARN